MLEKICKIWTQSKRRRRRILDNVRRQIADCGYALDDLSDSELEAAISRGAGGIEKVLPLTGKAIYWTLRRLSPDHSQIQRRKIKKPPQTQRAGNF
jgi:hypothetical protein